MQTTNDGVMAWEGHEHTGDKSDAFVGPPPGGRDERSLHAYYERDVETAYRVG